MMDNALKWQKTLNHTNLQKGFNTTVSCKNKVFCMTHYRGKFKAIDQHTNTVGDLMLETLSNWGIQQAFGVAGPSNSSLIDSLQTQGKITYFEVSRESAAAFAVSAYGSLTGRPAACFAMSRFGSTHLLSALWDANVNRAPVVALTGQVTPKSDSYNQPFFKHYSNENVAQWSQTVGYNSQHTELANLACKNAILNRGVSHLIFPDGTPRLALKGPMQAGSPRGRLPSQNIAPPQDALQDAIDLLRDSERPAIIAGHGARDRMEAVIQLAEQLRAPVITTFKGKGLIPDNHPLAGGVLGLGGSPVASELVNEADALLVFGASFSQHTGISADRPTVQVDYELAALAKSHPIDVPVWGEIGVTAQALSDDFLGDMWTQDQTASIAAHWETWRQTKRHQALSTDENALNTAILFETLSEAVNPDAIITLDVDETTDTFGHYFECVEQSILMSGHPDSDGFAFPAAMGAWSATQENDLKFKDRQVISISGDIGFDRHLSEIHTAVKYKMNITHVLIKQETDGLDEQINLPDHSFADYAELCGAMGLLANDKAALDTALAQALAYDGPALVEVTISQGSAQ
ncbi:MAG: thiamine pyrophosphate-binding protein [Leucothrix sp.]